MKTTTLLAVVVLILLSVMPAIITSGEHGHVGSTLHEIEFSNQSLRSDETLTMEVEMVCFNGLRKSSILTVTIGEFDKICEIIEGEGAIEDKIHQLIERGFTPPGICYSDFENETERVTKRVRDFSRFYDGNETGLIINFGCLHIISGHGRAITRLTTFVKAFLNQIFGYVFQVMPPFFTVIPEIDMLFSTDGALLTLNVFGKTNNLSPLYFVALLGFVGLHWRILTMPVHFFMGASAAVIAFGVPQEENR